MTKEIDVEVFNLKGPNAARNMQTDYYDRLGHYESLHWTVGLRALGGYPTQNGGRIPIAPQ